ncbi:MAG: deaminase [Candidatus Woesearchaeota archaeon]
MADKIANPYIPEGRTLLYIPANHELMKKLENYARIMSLDKEHPTASFVVRDGEIIGRGANGSEYHEKHGCKRKSPNTPTGQGYESCEGCHPKNHSEQKAIRHAKEAGHDTENADIYLWGDWRVCKPCWGSILEAKISKVYLMEGSEYLFNNKDARNIIGKIFEK